MNILKIFILLAVWCIGYEWGYYRGKQVNIVHGCVSVCSEMLETFGC